MCGWGVPPTPAIPGRSPRPKTSIPSQQPLAEAGSITLGLVRTLLPVSTTTFQQEIVSTPTSDTIASLKAGDGYPLWDSLL